ncbi:MAG: hypothetical protein BMS9Abin07_1355 [Acidimicrobiia bacterium]|nr:MAG: hypothetical protein BMS9Abin07_1355 [Acidimicrobiia bacterium]
MRVLTTTVLGAVVALTAAQPVAATVPGDNGKIAFVSDRDGNSEIYVVDADGSDPVNLTSNPAADSAPSWSPDGRQIAFASDRDGERAIYVMNGDGTAPTRLVPGGDPAWSPDGMSIAFTLDSDIYAMSSDGSGATRITDAQTDPAPPLWTSSVSDVFPAWSPDGSRLAFVRQFLGPTPTAGVARLYVVDVDGGGAPVSLGDVAWSADPPDWSPNGLQIAIGAIGTQMLQASVELVNVDGSGSTTLPIPSGFTHSRQPAWSPDGARIAATAFVVNVTPIDIFVMKSDGSGTATNITNNPASDTDPAWQPLNPYPSGLFDPATGMWHLRSRDARITTFYYGNPGDSPMMGDWDCDGVDTPGLYRQSDGHVYLRNSNTQGTADVRFYFGNPGDIPLAGDFDGDGCDTVSVYRPSEGRVYVINELGANGGGLGVAELSYYFGNPGDQPFVGDFDGDGMDTIGLHRASTGLVYFRNSHTQGNADDEFIFGNPGDRLFASDWNGDGTDSPALFRPGNTTVYFRFTNTQGNADTQYLFGESAWLPIAGEFGLN